MMDGRKDGEGGPVQQLVRQDGVQVTKMCNYKQIILKLFFLQLTFESVELFGSLEYPASKKLDFFTF